MREIKFRAWDNVANCMYYAGEESSIFFELASEGLTAYDLTEEENSPLYRMEHLKYQQFTGLKDMNNEEIYECDVLYFPAYETHTNNRVVKFELGQFVGELIRSNYSKSLKEIVNEMEVIGNIYENPELLEGNP